MRLENRITAKSILVVGDIMLDRYYNGDIKRISPEAPVPVFLKGVERYVLGGAGNVAVNLAAAGQKVSVLSIIGDDENGRTLLKTLHDYSIETKLVAKDPNRRTTVKTRFIGPNNQQVFRLDEEDTCNINDTYSSLLLKLLNNNIKKYDLVVLSDYLKGVLTREFTQGVISIANSNDVRVIIDVKDPYWKKYSNAFLLKPNLSELRQLTQLPARTDSEIEHASLELCRQSNCKYVLTTCGKRGMILVESSGKSIMINSTAREVYDVTGAGDTGIAYLGACLANNIDIWNSAVISNFAAGIQVSKVGTSPVFLHEVDNFLKESNRRNSYVHKLITWSDLEQIRRDFQEKKIVFTNGCFDILHIGHVEYLRKAATYGDVLVVGVNSDVSVKRLKGETRPVNNEHDRSRVLAALEFIDYVIVFSEDTPYKLIKELQPDILVKGADYTIDQVVGRDIVEQRGGCVKLVPLVEGVSTTKIIQKISY